MLTVGYTASFVRRFKKLDAVLQREIKLRIEEFRDLSNHQKLKVHKLGGRLRGKHSFSINFSDCIVFKWSKDKKTVYLLDVGDHGVWVVC